MDLLEGGCGALSGAAAGEKKGKQGLVFECAESGEVGLLGRHGIPLWGVGVFSPSLLALVTLNEPILPAALHPPVPLMATRSVLCGTCLACSLPVLPHPWVLQGRLRSGPHPHGRE